MNEMGFSAVIQLYSSARTNNTFIFFFFQNFQHCSESGQLTFI